MALLSATPVLSSPNSHALLAHEYRYGCPYPQQLPPLKKTPISEVTTASIKGSDERTIANPSTILQHLRLHLLNPSTNKRTRVLTHRTENIGSLRKHKEAHAATHQHLHAARTKAGQVDCNRRNWKMPLPHLGLLYARHRVGTPRSARPASSWRSGPVSVVPLSPRPGKSEVASECCSGRVSNDPRCFCPVVYRWSEQLATPSVRENRCRPPRCRQSHLGYPRMKSSSRSGSYKSGQVTRASLLGTKRKVTKTIRALKH